MCGVKPTIIPRKTPFAAWQLDAKNWLLAEADSGGERTAVLYSVIKTSRLNGMVPEARLLYVIADIQEWPVNRVHNLPSWNTCLTSV